MGLHDVTEIALGARENGILEAPRRLADGTIWFTDLAGGVLRLAPGAEEPEVVVPRRKGVGGLAVHRDGGVVVTGRTVVHVDGDRQRELLALDEVRGFNDLHVAADGSLLVGALRYAPMAGEEPVPGEVWRLPADGGAAELVTGDITWPNGIGTSPDGARMYVSDTAHGTIRVFAAEGGEGEVFATVPAGIADGLAVDAEGGVWVALGTGEVAHFDAAGTLVERVSAPTRFASSICFCGHDVVISAALGLFSARSDIPGLVIPPAAI